jgi:hypothetical protein
MGVFANDQPLKQAFFKIHLKAVLIPSCIRSTLSALHTKAPLVAASRRYALFRYGLIDIIKDRRIKDYSVTTESL